MSADGTADSAAANLNLTPDEKRVYGQLFRQADSDSVGVVTGEIAVKFFEKTRLDSRILGEIWQIADRDNRGFLTPAGFGIVLRLIGHAQAGREPTAELALQPGPLPRFDGITTGPSSTPQAAAALQPQGTGGGPVRIPPLTPEKVSQYAGLFERQNLQAGNMLPGDQAKQIFEKSGLPNEILGKIWQLADTEQRGALVLTEFVIAMHLLTSIKSGALRGLPTILPAALYEAATRRVPAPRQSPTSTGPLSAIPRQLSGSAQIRTGSPLGRSPLATQATGAGSSDWLVTPADKVRFDQIYTDIDKAGKGFITGEEAVGFFSQSNLPEDTLAQIWDLADIKSEGRLNRDEFAVAMYLIRQQRSRRDGTNVLPATIPPNLIPPSMRNQIQAPTASTAFDIPVPTPPQQQKSALDDLFGLDSSPTPPPPAPVQAAFSTGGSNVNDPFAVGTGILAPGSPAKPSPTATTFKPFVPSSSFGRGLTAQPTGDSTGSGPAIANQSIAQSSIPQDLLGDHDQEVSNKASESMELANLSNQIGSLSKQTKEVQAQKATMQSELGQISVQRKTFEQRLAQLRTLYEKEASDVRSLETQLAAARNETKKLQAECLTLEGTYKDIQNKHSQTLAGLQADQQENANIKEKIKAVNAEIAQLKPKIEKMKSEARQQKGLVAINKKQLSTNETEREKLKTEMDDLAKSNEDLSRQISSGSPTSASGQVASPTPSTASANNPFFRRTGSTDIMGTFASPTIKPFSDKSFDDVFGPSFPPVGSTSTPPPPTSFKPQTTGTSTESASSFATPGAPTSNVARQATLAAEPPPPPPESRQISSSLLPLSNPSESLGSSRQVSPPTSRDGGDAASANPTSIVAAFPVEAITTGPAATVSEETLKAGASPEESKLASNGTATAPAEAATKSAAVTAGDTDPFGTLDQAKAKADFDNAFAAFASANKNQDKTPADSANAISNFNSEFPPISEFERDEESDSASEEGGFDDDFAPASPPAKGEKTETGKETSLTADAKPEAPTIPPAAPESRPDSGEEPEKSDKLAAEAPHFGGPFFPEPSKVDDIFGGTPSTAPAPTAPPTAAPATASHHTPFDDLDDDFEGLEDAKEGSADDDFATISRSGLDDFNHVFDSSPPASQSKSESTAFGVESSFDLASVSANSATGPGGSTSNLGADSSAGSAGKAPAAPEAHDWDAIFATLDSPSDSAATATAAEASKETQTPAARPSAPGRALTEDGEHDDPILKNLTSMGFSRADALSALEKYDYNLERAANHLTNES